MRAAAAALLLLLAAACAHAPAAVQTSVQPGLICKGKSYPADAPCLEAGQPAPFGGILARPELVEQWVEAPAEKQAENDSLRKSNAANIAIIGTAVALIIAAGIGGFELGQAVK